MNQEKSFIKLLLLTLMFLMVFSFFNTVSAPQPDYTNIINETESLSQIGADAAAEPQPSTQNDTNVVTEPQSSDQNDTNTVDETQLSVQNDTNISASDVITQAAPGFHGEITELTPVGTPYNELGPIQILCTVTNTGTINITSGTLRLTIRSRGRLINWTSVSTPALAPGESYTYTWYTTNENFPRKDNYNLSARWEIWGWSWPHSYHDTVYASTTFYSVPSPWLIVGIAGFLMAIAVLARKKRWWLSFYLTGAVALVALIISFFLLTGYDTIIMGIEASNIAYLASVLGIPSNFLPPNAFIFPDPTGWSIFGIGFECSSIIEISVLVGLLLLYPGYTYKRKMKYAAIGIVATYAANLIRMLSIIYIVNIFGKSTLYFAHAFIGKIIFFAFVIVLYWYLLTRPTLGIVRDNIKSGKFNY